MRKPINLLAVATLAAALAAPIMTIGCGGPHYYRAYDPYYHDYHTWNHDEVVYYQNWEHETHRDHVEFKKRNQADQKEYWDWRHNHH